MSVNLDEPLCYFRNDEVDALTVGQSFEGVCIFGGTGSGKTSGSGRTIALAMLKRGWGGLVLTAKVDECQLWEEYARETGRSKDVIVVDANYSYRLNFLQYEFDASGQSSSFVSEITNVLNSAINAGVRSNDSSDPFWELSTKQILRAAIQMLVFSQRDLKLVSLLDVINGAPRSNADVVALKEAFDKKRNLEGSHARMCGFLELYSAADSYVKANKNDYNTVSDWNPTYDYWFNQFPNADPTTRSNVLSVLMARLSEMLYSPFKALFSTDSTVIPDDSWGEGKTGSGNRIIIVDLPIKKYGDSGRLAQTIFKLIWQRAAERRRRKDLPVFLWADEAQFFVVKEDAFFQQTARSSCAATVYLSQSVTNYRLALGETGDSNATDSLLGNFQTKIFHANGCPITNEYAERLLGQTLRKTDGRSYGNGVTLSQQSNLQPVKLAKEFIILKKGGAANGKIVEGIAFQAGRCFKETNSYWTHCEFKQK